MINFSDYSSKVVSSGAQSLYELKTLKAHGLHKVELSNVCLATLVSKLTYASPSWWRFASNAAKTKLQALVTKVIKYGVYDLNMPNIEQICEKADTKLSWDILNNSEHVLHQFLPSYHTHSYALRARMHDRQ